MTSSLWGGSASRLAAIAAVTGTVFVGALAVRALHGEDSTASLIQAPTTPTAQVPTARGAEEIDAWLVEADVTLLPDLGYRLDIRLTRDVGAPPPDRIRPIVVVRMEGLHDIEPPLMIVGLSDWQAEGTLPRPGRWQFGIGFGEDLVELVVDVPPAGDVI